MRPFFKHPTCAPCFLETSNRKNPSFRVSQKHTPFPNLCYAHSVTATTMQTNGDAGARSVAAFPKAEVRLRTRLTRPENTKEQKGTERNDGFSKNWNYPALRHRTIQQPSNPRTTEIAPRFQTSRVAHSFQYCPGLSFQALPFSKTSASLFLLRKAASCLGAFVVQPSCDVPPSVFQHGHRVYPAKSGQIRP